MNERFEFVTTNCSGHSVRGSISATAGSLINSGVMEVDLPHLGPGTIDRKDRIDVFVVVDDLRYQVFTGVVSSILARGELLRIEFVTETAYMQVASVQPRVWVNGRADLIVKDILSFSSFPSSSFQLPDSLGSVLLHSWNTDGGTVADEIQALLDHVAPSLSMSGGLDSFAFVGGRASLAQALPPFLYPSNEMTSEPDVDGVSFSLRPCFPGSACFDVDGGFLGTVDRVRFIIEPRSARTEIILDRAYDSEIASLGAA